MQKFFSLFIISVIVLSESAQIVLAQPNSSLSPVSQAQKPPFTTANDGVFLYGVKTPRGGNLRMEVSWEVSKSQPSRESVRISGVVKYKNPATGKLDILSIDENKSYIDQSGRLYFSLPTISERAFGPVELSAVESARRKKADETAKEGAPDPVKSDLAAKDANKPSSVSEPNKPAAPSAALTDEAVLDNPADEDSLSPTASKDAVLPSGVAVNDTFMRSGSFKVDDYEIEWVQGNFRNGSKYPVDSKAIRITSSKKGGKKIEVVLKLGREAYLRSDGRVRVWVDGPMGRDRQLISKESFHTKKFKLLKKAIAEIKDENEFLQKSDLKLLPGTLKNKNSDVVMTKGALMLGGAIRSIGAHNVAYAHMKQSTLAKKTFDNVHRLLQQEKMGFMVHRVAIHSGLKVNHHKTHGRSLIRGGTAAEHEARAQQATVNGLVRYAPNPPWIDDLTGMVYEFGFDFRTTAGQQRHALLGILARLNNDTATTAYVTNIADYLAGQRVLFAVDINEETRNNLRSYITFYFRHVNALRRGGGYIGDFNQLRAAFLQFLGNVNGLRITPPQFLEMLDRLPGFQRTPDDLRLVANDQLVLALRRRAELDRLLGVNRALPTDLLQYILTFMIVMAPSGV